VLFLSPQEVFLFAQVFLAPQEVFLFAQEVFLAPQVFPFAQKAFLAPQEVFLFAQEVFPFAQEVFPFAQEVFPFAQEVFLALLQLVASQQDSFEAEFSAPKKNVLINDFAIKTNFCSHRLSSPVTIGGKKLILLHRFCRWRVGLSTPALLFVLARFGSPKFN
jgi:hypothetical protein